MSPTPSSSAVLNNKPSSEGDARKELVPITNFTNNASTINTGRPSKVTPNPAGPPLPSWVLDEREAAQIARRRRILQERAVRIHQPRTTSIAVDVDALTHQVNERLRQEEEERRKDQDYGHLATTQDRAALLLEHQENKERQNRCQQLTRFWKDDQRFDKRREYDLNSHDHVISSLYLLKFDGEDLEMRDRIKQQKQQTKSWLLQQMEEQHQQQLHQREKDRLQELQQMDVAEKSRQLAKADEECRKALEMAHLQYNRLLRNCSCKQIVCQSNFKKKIISIVNTVDLITSTKTKLLNMRTDREYEKLYDEAQEWKGMSPQQKKDIKKIQEKQIQEKKRRDEEERRREKDWNDQAFRCDRAGLLLAHKEEIQRRDEENKQLFTNNQLAQDQKLNQSRLNTILTTNIPNEEYYKHFGVYPR
ncbi:LOW QUALITY PROTEIN: RIB43A-like with coiled-coils protein 1 [Palaemon carinicauda]|uniref:LOW QUALITY PROTEIN: RIB43A-like with coiled-coils protein 1 n=1 Tax=Palaemon carinicauda TaxID=392227 RepID=UPI0035B5F28B